MENNTTRLRVRVKRSELMPLKDAHVRLPEPLKTRRILTEVHKEAFINFEKETRVSLLHLKASHTLWQEMCGRLNAITSEKGAREPPQWRASIFNWKNRVMAKKAKKENMSPIDRAASQHWGQGLLSQRVAGEH